MEEMIYCEPLEERKILDSGEYEGYKYYIVSLGTHPCAYVEIPKGHKYYGKIDGDAYDLDIDVHGGITFGDWNLCGVSDNYMIGWDYSHYNDFSYSFANVFVDDFGHFLGKKWTTEEILKDVKSVIHQVKGVE